VGGFLDGDLIAGPDVAHIIPLDDGRVAGNAHAMTFSAFTFSLTLGD